MALGETKTASAYGITEGKVLVNGVAYDITQGKTLVNGVAYDIGGDTPIAVTITGTGYATQAYCIIAGTTYYSATSGIEVSPQDTITFYVRSASSKGTASITIDGTVIWSGSNGTYTYQWTVPSGITNITINMAYNNNAWVNWGSITVTTE